MSCVNYILFFSHLVIESKYGKVVLEIALMATSMSKRPVEYMKSEVWINLKRSVYNIIFLTFTRLTCISFHLSYTLSLPLIPLFFISIPVSLPPVMALSRAICLALDLVPLDWGPFKTEVILPPKQVYNFPGRSHSANCLQKFRQLLPRQFKKIQNTLSSVYITKEKSFLLDYVAG